MLVRRGPDFKINSTRNGKSPNGDDKKSPRKREREVQNCQESLKSLEYRTEKNLCLEYWKQCEM